MPAKTSRRQLDPQTRSRICELRSIGWSHRRIHERHPHIPLGTIKTTLYREHLRDNNVTRRRPGAPRKLKESKDQTANIKQQVEITKNQPEKVKDQTAAATEAQQEKEKK